MLQHDDNILAGDGGQSMTGDRTALVGHVGRTGVRFALTDPSGTLLEETARDYEAERHATISAALMAFKDDCGLTSLPRRCALAVAGIPRGETVSVTSSRWFISKAGLTAILQRPPLVINDLAAKVWTVGASGEGHVEAAGERAPSSGPGTYVLIGMGNGLGVAAFIRDEQQSLTIVSSEAGHSDLVDPSPEMAPIVERIRSENRFCSAESLLSSDGLAAIYNVLIDGEQHMARAASAEEVIAAASRGQERAEKACILYTRALWRFAANLVLIYGAWDGLFFTGRIARALRGQLANPQVRQNAAVAGPFANILRNVPAGLLLLEHSTLRGAAEALRSRD